jgi:hypothetical protein
MLRRIDQRAGRQRDCKKQHDQRVARADRDDATDQGSPG